MPNRGNAYLELARYGPLLGPGRGGYIGGNQTRKNRLSTPPKSLTLLAGTYGTWWVKTALKLSNSIDNKGKAVN